jgi:nitrate/TMAO reductase-like tetraheme cytochrome c subunit
MVTMKKEFIIIILILTFLSISAVNNSPQLFVTSENCTACHNQLIGLHGEDLSVGSDWSGSMMANSARDPYWQAAIRRETMKHPKATKAIQNECAGCHLPMTRYMAKTQGLKGEVFSHFPIIPNDAPNHDLAADGVSCTICHQIREDKLESKESFTAGFVVDTKIPMSQRKIYGPYDIDKGRQHLMQSSSKFVPQKANHIQRSEFCASCHTLYTHTLNAKGEVIGTLPEQVPYLEWKHSDYAESQSCQSCHMPQVENQVFISSVLGIPREKVSRHAFQGGNFLIPKILNKYREELGVKALPQNLQATAERSRIHLQNRAAEIEIPSAKISDNTLCLEVQVRNLAGHKLPTAYPSRRTWIHLTVMNQNDKIIFESGKLNRDGSINGNENDSDKKSYEPHYLQITQSDQVQIYEAIMADENDTVTTVLLSGIRYLKDNRILPKGFDKKTADKDCAVYGKAKKDSDFLAPHDQISYHIPITPLDGPFRIQAELCYQPIGYRWAQNLSDQSSEETDRFIAYYQTFSNSSTVILARQYHSIAVKLDNKP